MFKAYPHKKKPNKNRNHYIASLSHENKPWYTLKMKDIKHKEQIQANIIYSIYNLLFVGFHFA